MNNLNYDVYRSIVNESNARILKASNDAQLLRSLSNKPEEKPEVRSKNVSLPRLINLLTSYFLKRQTALTEH